ncbi:uncharacterized protein LOC117181684 [Belonocnema kinseyi]|uniref:uncharacterized protein LOC117181684 n=1 Tax=Belonocnema kinseyi TaxID=2817044 RepID=UPI00143CC3DE|nr:uncharacterized protein LOC117181684 [Belonocnema kinseyi]
MKYCFVLVCKKHIAVHPGIRLFRILISITEKDQKFIGKSRAGPSDLSTRKLIILSKRRREIWISVLRRGPLSASQLKNARICKEHFMSVKLENCAGFGADGGEENPREYRFG